MTEDIASFFLSSFSSGVLRFIFFKNSDDDMMSMGHQRSNIFVRMFAIVQVFKSSNNRMFANVRLNDSIVCLSK